MSVFPNPLLPTYGRVSYPDYKFFHSPSIRPKYAEENKLDIHFNEKMKPGTYQLIFDWTEPPGGVAKKLTGEALSIVMSDDMKYRNDYYGLLAVVQVKGT